jgi:aspartate racemase
MKKLGVIGGMGSEATSYYFKELIAHTKAETDQDYIDTIILNHASLPDRTKAILTGGKRALTSELIKDAKLLEKIGVETIAIPCNTVHYFYEDMQKEISIPIIHMVKETLSHTLKHFEGVKKVGIMGTTGTIEAGVYHKECEKLGLETVVPSEGRQLDVMALIYDEIKKGLPGDVKKFDRVYQELMAAGSDVIILACTELSVFYKENKNYENCLDAMDVLVEESIRRSGAVYQ